MDFLFYLFIFFKLGFRQLLTPAAGELKEGKWKVNECFCEQLGPRKTKFQPNGYQLLYHDPAFTFPRPAWGMGEEGKKWC